VRTALRFLAGTVVALLAMWGIAQGVQGLTKSPVLWDEVVFGWMFIVGAIVIYKFTFSRRPLYEPQPRLTAGQAAGVAVGGLVRTALDWIVGLMVLAGLFYVIEFVLKSVHFH
jgi:hypothetical protein